MDDITKYPFDIFLSYKSQDSKWVNELKHSLQSRGIKVWLDRDEIRPGDLFAMALEDGLDTSRCVGLVVTPESLHSKWVREEYYRAISLSNNRGLQLIPLLLQSAELPGFLAGRQYIDFRNQAEYENNVNRLVWPGITGQQIAILIMNSFGGNPWSSLTTVLRELNCNIYYSEYVESAKWQIEDLISSGYRIVVLADIFEGWPFSGRGAWRAPDSYVNQIFEIREKFRGTQNEVVFVLYQNERALKDFAPNSLEQKAISRLSHYFTIPMSFKDHNGTEPADKNSSEHKYLRQSTYDIWIQVQRELLRQQRR